MKREKAIQEINRKITALRNIEVLVNELPLDTYLLIKYRTYDLSVNHDIKIEVVCKINHFNKDSIQVSLLAVSSDTANPFASHKYNENIKWAVLKYTGIKGFSILREEDMPLFFGFPLQYDLYRSVLKGFKGELK